MRVPTTRPSRGPVRARDDAGMTLVEVLVAMTLFLVLLAITFPVLNTFFSVDTGVTKTVAAINQILPATTTFERYLRSAVEPAPPVVVTPGLPGTPVPMFAPVAGSSPVTYQMGPNALTFSSNVGDPNGPELVQASTSGPDASGLYTLTITATKANPGTCPGAAAPMSTSPTSRCTYTAANALPIAIINSVTNGSAADPSPIFQYSTVNASNGTPTFVSPATVPLGWTCTSASACNPATLSSMQITIDTRSTVGGLTSVKTVVYFQAPNYSVNVG